jgi:hypothetical protein
MFIDVLAIVSFGNIFATQKKEAEEFGTTCFFWGGVSLVGKILFSV